MTISFKLFKYNAGFRFFNKNSGIEVWSAKLPHEVILFRHVHTTFRHVHTTMKNLRRDMKKVTDKKKSREELLFSLEILLQIYTGILVPGFRKALYAFIRGELATRCNIHLTDEELGMLWPQIGLEVDAAGNLCKDDRAHD